jgi:DNA-binding CsgD family transcriptional regulator
MDQAGSNLARAIPYAGACWHTIDPATLIETRFRTVNLPPRHGQVAEFEYLRRDYNKFVDLARAPRHSGVLSEATQGDLQRSGRYRAFLAPLNIRGELRTSLVVDGSCWGSFALFREAPSDFSEEERDLAHELGVILGRGFRTALVDGLVGGGADTQTTPAGPGMILLDEERRVQSTTATAHRWLAELQFTGDPTFDGLPHALLAVAECARATGRDATARVPGASGGWVLLHASPVSSAADGRHHSSQVAIIIQSATASSIAPLIAAAYGLSRRERALTELVLQGHGTREIAARLYISPHTVQEHLKSIFAKIGVRSRRELVGQVFLRHYQPCIEPVEEPI